MLCNTKRIQNVEHAFFFFLPFFGALEKNSNLEQAISIEIKFHCLTSAKLDHLVWDYAIEEVSFTNS